MPTHPGRCASANPGTSSGGWSRATPPARRPRDETQSAGYARRHHLWRDRGRGFNSRRLHWTVGVQVPRVSGGDFPQLANLAQRAQPRGPVRLACLAEDHPRRLVARDVVPVAVHVLHARAPTELGVWGVRDTRRRPVDGLGRLDEWWMRCMCTCCCARGGGASGLPPKPAGAPGGVHVPTSRARAAVSWRARDTRMGKNETFAHALR
jgi:hypothetical protein